MACAPTQVAIGQVLQISELVVGNDALGFWHGIVCCTLVVVSLNWETLGHPLKAPKQAVAGFPISVQQHEILERLEDQLTHFMSVSEFAPDDLGRAAVKFRDLIQLSKELPQCTFEGEDLESVVFSLHASFDPYCSKGLRHKFEDEQPEPDHNCSKAKPEVRPRLNVGSLPVVADRVKVGVST